MWYSIFHTRKDLHLCLGAPAYWIIDRTAGGPIPVLQVYDATLVIYTYLQISSTSAVSEIGAFLDFIDFDNDFTE